MTATEAVRTRWRRPGWLLPAAWTVVTAVFLLAPSLGLINLPWMRQIILVALLALIVSGLNLSFGFAGELSFASAAMYAAGAYATGYLAMNAVNDLALAILISSIFGLLLGLISGIPGLRLGGWMLATSSFFLVILVPDIVDIFRDALGGHQGMTGIPRAQLFGVDLGDTGLYLAVIAVTSFWFILYRNLVISRSGNALAVLRQSPVLASSLGISVYGLKLKAYALAGIPAAIAGAFFAYLDGFIAPENFGMNFTIAILAAAILGGKRSVYGVFLGAAIMQLGPMRTSLFGDFAFIAYGVLLVVVGVLLPGGIAGGIAELKSRFRRSRSTRATSRRTGAVVDKPVFAPLPGKRLAVSGIGKAFGAVAALTGVTFEAQPGQVVALIGPNGSGKTTLLNAISGFYRADSGTVLLGEETISGLSPHRVADAGVMRTFQTPVVPEMTVRDAVATARYRSDRVTTIETMLRLPRYRSAVRRDRAAVDAVLAACGLSDVADLPATSLPLGTRRVLELARALVVNPSLVLLDEVASGLDEEEVQSLADVVRAVREAGGTVLLVEHNFSLVRDLADHVVVLSQGKLVAEGDPDTIAQHPEVLHHYLGEPVDAAAVTAGDTIADDVDEDDHFVQEGADDGR